MLHNTVMILPPVFLERLSKIYKDDASMVIDALSSTPPLVVRINTLKASKECVIHQLNLEHITYELVDWCPEVLVITNQDTKSFSSNEFVKNGSVYIQNTSSILASLILTPKPDSKVLDLAAAPGSKTSHLAAIMKNTGEIIANDVSRDRCYKLRANLERLGVENTSVVTMLGERLWEKYPEYFDYVLIDAPCSMESMIGIDTTICSNWSVKNDKNLAKKQKWLLRSAVSAAKVGAEIVYSTCTLSPEENEEVINWVLEKEKGKIEVIEVVFPSIQLMDGLVEWNGNSFSPTLSLTKRIVPSILFEGFYIAKIRKIQSTIPSYLREV